ncbi:MAG: F0F1 ATP synthase subunit B [Oscillospiraceae bacterium]|nr:F0F1 ATP synthase subunit B [Oscillospiraceae bacterium]
MDLHPADILINIINIAVLFFLLRLILWKPVNRYLSERTKRVRKELEDAEKTLLDAEALKQEYTVNLEDIEAHGRDVMRESRAKASEEAEEILGEAREKARGMISEARERINEERELAIDNARREIAQLATDMASRILKREVLPEDNAGAVEDFFSETR